MVVCFVHIATMGAVAAICRVLLFLNGIGSFPFPFSCSGALSCASAKINHWNHIPTRIINIRVSAAIRIFFILLALCLFKYTKKRALAALEMKLWAVDTRVDAFWIRRLLFVFFSRKKKRQRTKMTCNVMNRFESRLKRLSQQQSRKNIECESGWSTLAHKFYAKWCIV